jgi:hypothetical protein
MRLMLMPLRSASSETVPVTLVSSVRILPAFVRYLSGSLKLWMPTCWIGTCTPWTVSLATSIMSGSVAR